MERITVVIEYDTDADIPPFWANMTALGGRIIMVAFEDVLSEKEEEGGNHD